MEVCKLGIDGNTKAVGREGNGKVGRLNKMGMVYKGGCEGRGELNKVAGGNCEEER